MKSRVSAARQNNCFTNTSKDLMRQHNLDVVKRGRGLWTNDTGQLRCDWVELAGDSIHQTIQLLESNNALRPGGFIGIDQDRDRIHKHQQARPDLKWLTGDLRHHVSWLCCHADVGVLNFDGYLEVGSREAAALFTTIRPLIQRGISRFGSFVLFSNNDLDSVWRHPKSRHSGRPDVAVRMHTEAVLEKLSSYADRRELPSFETLLPPGFETKVNSRHFEGSLGAYWIYSGTKLGHRMIELGLIL